MWRLDLVRSIKAAVLAGGYLVALWPAAAGAVVIFQATITNPLFAANANVAAFENCRANQGCLGNAGLVDSDNDGDIDGADVDTLPDTLSFAFPLTLAQKNAITMLAAGSATLSMTAARDIGGKTVPSGDHIVTTMELVALGNLFQNTLDTCPAGERGGPGYPADQVCGPNFHTDVLATTSLAIGLAALQTAAANQSIDFVFDPTNSIGRLKIQQIQLVVQSVPEPSSVALLALSLLALGAVRRTRKLA